MPRLNQPRTIANEANLARRIAFERERRGLSYEGLAKLMTEAGCSIQGSAIYRIEKGDPPRRVTVDELVALGQVFKTSLDDLLTPVELIEQRRARELIGELTAAGDALDEAISRMFRVFVAFNELAEGNPELSEYVDQHWQASGADLPDLPARIAAKVIAPEDDKRGVPHLDGHPDGSFARQVDALISTLQLCAARQVIPPTESRSLTLDNRRRVVPSRRRQPKGKA